MTSAEKLQMTKSLPGAPSVRPRKLKPLPLGHSVSPEERARRSARMKALAERRRAKGLRNPSPFGNFNRNVLI